jgi:hypothetical protein
MTEATSPVAKPAEPQLRGSELQIPKPKSDPSYLDEMGTDGKVTKWVEELSRKLDVKTAGTIADLCIELILVPLTKGKEPTPAAIQSFWTKLNDAAPIKLQKGFFESLKAETASYDVDLILQYLHGTLQDTGKKDEASALGRYQEYAEKHIPEFPS